MSKLYKVGFYGGKFMPLHLGHEYCIRTAAEQCEKVHVILFYGGDDELEIRKNYKNIDYLSLESRLEKLNMLCNKYNNIQISTIDVTQLKFPNGEEDWDAETPLVVAITGYMDVVYSSEPSYDKYFKRAYPWAKHILVDPPRVNYPISGTKIREMTNIEEKEKWML